MHGIRNGARSSVQLQKLLETVSPAKKSCEADEPISRALAVNAVSQSVMRVGKQGHFNP